jgi:putative aldouronate transport system substrate-binding protein
MNAMQAKEMSRRRFLQAMAAALGGTVVASCTPKATPTVESVQATTAPAATTAPQQPAFFDAPEIAPIAATKPAPLGWVAKVKSPPFQYDPPMHISMNAMFNNAIEYVEGETLEDNWWTRWQKDKLGLVFDNKWSGGWYTDATKELWATSMASNDFPEMMLIPDRAIYNRLLTGGVLEDITDIWEKTASPLTKQKKNWPHGMEWQPFKSKDGRMHCIYAINTEEAGLDVLTWARKDWLEKVGASEPKTLDDIYSLGKAFMDKGLAKYGLPLCQSIVAWIGTADPIFGAYGAMPFIWQKAADNTLSYGSLDPKVKDALALLAKWFKEGFIDPEFATKDEGGSYSDITAGKTGLCFGPYWCYGWPFPDTKATDPNADFVYFDMPAGPGGKKGRRGMNLYEGTPVSFLKGTDPKKIETIIQLTNWAYDRRANWSETKDYHNTYGPMVEGYEYHWEGDNVVLGPKGTCAIWCYSGSYTGNPAPYAYPGMFMDLISEIQKIEKRDPATYNGFEKFITSDHITAYQRQAYSLTYATRDEQFLDQYMGVPSTEMTEIGDQLSKMEKELFTQIINGTRPVDDFDAFVKDWKSQGGDTITAEVNDWYKSVSG